MRKQKMRKDVLRAMRNVPGGLPLMVFFLVTVSGAAIYFAAAGVFCLRQHDPLFARCCLLFAAFLVSVEAVGLLAAVWQERCPRFYRFMWGGR